MVDEPGARAPQDETPDDPERSDRRFTDFVRRAVSAGVEAASRSKDDLVRVATTEIQSWLDRIDLNTELVKALSRMVVDVRAEIRFRPAPDGKLVPEATGDAKVRSADNG